MKPDPYAAMMAVLKEPLTPQEIANRVGMRNGSHLGMIRRLYDIGAVTREKVEGHGTYKYLRTQETITREEVSQRIKERFKSENTPITGGRIISFEGRKMQEKLRESDRLHRRKSGKIYVSGNWKFD